ncbi:MAG: four helix bundle protein [Candidatus Omnitrophica bacterium]|nr:four helix bundle protein [Candidatus Omnitrophota bacterium]MCB9721865.1 four helix bundle protein [Candidatus Omnitrophota bacterium]
MIREFQDLYVWQKAHQLTLCIYKATRDYPQSEEFSLTSQIRKAAVSVCANIAEGKKKKTRDFARFLQISHGSLEEIKYYLILSCDLGYLEEAESRRMYEEAEEVGRMLHGLRSKLESR